MRRLKLLAVLLPALCGLLWAVSCTDHQREELPLRPLPDLSQGGPAPADMAMAAQKDMAWHPDLGAPPSDLATSASDLAASAADLAVAPSDL